MADRRNNTLDILKLLASYMVVFIHVMFWGRIGVIVDALARFAVPLFFLVSGYYADNASPEKLRQRTYRLMRMLILASLAYVVYDVFWLFLDQGTQEVIRYFQAYTDPRNLLELLVFNSAVHTAHLWYLLAGIYVYGIFCMVKTHEVPTKVLLAAAILLLTLHLALGEFLAVFHVVLPIQRVRNFALTGLPFFCFGMIANRYQQKIKMISAGTIVAFILIGALETVLSRYFFGKNELYIGTLLILVSLVAIFIKYPDRYYPPRLLALTGCSTYIYLCHPMIAALLWRVYAMLGVAYGDSFALQMIHPLIVCVLSTGLAYAVIRTKQKQTMT